MSFGKTHYMRQLAASKHARQKHICPLCGKECKGNGYYTHKKYCTKKKGEGDNLEE